MSNIKVILFILVCLFFNTPIHASPTSNEFIPCKKKAVAILEFCLQDNESNCWLKSKADFETCRKRVTRSHKPNYGRIKAAEIHQDALKKTK